MLFYNKKNCLNDFVVNLKVHFSINPKFLIFGSAMNFIDAAQWGCTILRALINRLGLSGGCNAVNCSVITFIAPRVVPAWVILTPVTLSPEYITSENVNQTEST